MYTLEKEIPSATFVGTVRNPTDTFVSWYGLAQAASHVMAGGWSLPKEAAVEAHLEFWDLFGSAEMEFFKGRGKGEGGKKKVSVSEARSAELRGRDRLHLPVFCCSLSPLCDSLKQRAFSPRSAPRAAPHKYQPVNPLLPLLRLSQVVVPFKKYIEDQEGTVRGIYKSMGLPVNGEFEKALVADTERHQSYKAKRAYTNPELDELR